jgi:serine/threonine-protein kinase
MELLEGETLGRRLERVRRLGIAETARVLGQAARALQRAHQLGIVHRDFKPDNIVIFEDDEGRDQVKVLDFGVAKLVGALEDGDEAEGEARAEGQSPSFTRTGTVLGTPLYMAPEQIRNAADVDLRADIWAFGVVAFECLTGKAPFNGATLPELFERIQAGLHPSASFLEPGIPAGFDVWFDIACAPAPGKRFPNASVAWKHLTVALDLGANDASGSFPGLLDANATSGERRVLVVQPAVRPDESAPTLDVASEHPGELRTRTHGDGFASLQRIPLEGAKDGAHGESEAPLVTGDRRSIVDRPARSRLAWAVGAGLVTLVAALGVWRVIASPPYRSAPSPGGQVAEPSRGPVDTAAPAATASHAADEQPSAAPPASVAQGSSARREPPRPPAAKPTAASVLLAPVLASPDATSAPPEPPPRPPPAVATTAVVDPGSYR